VTLTGHLERMHFQTFGEAAWELQTTLTSSNDRRLTVYDRYDFSWHFVADYACRERPPPWLWPSNLWPQDGSAPRVHGAAGGLGRRRPLQRHPHRPAPQPRQRHLHLLKRSLRPSRARPFPISASGRQESGDRLAVRIRSSSTAAYAGPGNRRPAAGLVAVGRGGPRRQAVPSGLALRLVPDDVPPHPRR
jgi:hypothetical protein